MSNKIILFSIFIKTLLFNFAANGVYAQITSFAENFDDNELAGHWVFQDATFQGIEEDSVLKVQYNRTAESGIWEQFHLILPQVDVSNRPQISLWIKADIGFTLTLKPLNTNEISDWLQVQVPGDRQWREYRFELVNSPSAPLKNVFFYFDGGEQLIKSGAIWIDDLLIGDAVDAVLDRTLFEKAILDAGRLLDHLNTAPDYNVPPEQSLNLEKLLQTTRKLAEGLVDPMQQEYLDSLAYALYNACTQLESSAIFDLPHFTSDLELTRSAKVLLTNLHRLKGPRFLYGMHDATGYGVGWNGDDDRSDVQSVTGSYPALFSWDAHNITQKRSLDRFRYRIQRAHALGGVNTLVWHQYDPTGHSFYADELDAPTRVVADFLPGGTQHELYKERLQAIANFAKSLRDQNGQTIPILFRPYHEHNGWWFWWGTDTTTDADFIQLWRFTVEYLRDVLNVHSFIYVFSPDGNQIYFSKPYAYRYPGDDYVDILGLDFYFGSGAQTELIRFQNRVELISMLAEQKGKVAALTEVGDRKDWDEDDRLEIPEWHTRAVLTPLKESATAMRIAFLATWRNASSTHHFAPYPGHPAVPDFLRFYGDTSTVFLNNLVPGITERVYDSLNLASDAAHLFAFSVNTYVKGTIEGFHIQLDAVNGIDFSKVQPAFEASMNAQVSVNGKKQVSGQSVVDLTDSIRYTVVAEDGKTQNEYLLQLDLTTSITIPQPVPVEVDLYPLPARDFLFVETSHPIKTITLRQMNGQEVSPNGYTGSTNAYLGLAHLVPGTYVMRLEFAGGELVTKKLVLH